MTHGVVTIDLNCDLGEGAEGAADGKDAELLAVVTSANIACGGHAGDETTMAATVRGAMERGVAIGAHPGYPDRAGFGRVEMDLSPEQIEESVAAQIGALDRVARGLGARLGHVKPHGALYHAAMARPAVAEAVARAARRVGRELILVGLAGAPGLGVWRGMGMRVAAEGFADRRYEADGTLRARGVECALIDDPAEAAAQAVGIALGKGVAALDGTVVEVRADTICIHSDTPGAVGVALAVRAGLERAEVRVESIRSA